MLLTVFAMGHIQLLWLSKKMNVVQVIRVRAFCPGRVMAMKRPDGIWLTVLILLKFFHTPPVGSAWATAGQSHVEIKRQGL
jgi:hypothetical protein